MHRTGLAIALLALALSPIGAGATGGGSLAMLAFTAVFFLANAVIRPGAASFRDPGALALQAVTAGAFAALLVGLGQTIRALGQIEAEMGLEGWVVLAAWGAILARLIWRRSTGERAMKGAETALRVVHRAGQPRTDAKPKVTEPNRGSQRPKLAVLSPDSDETKQVERTSGPARDASADTQTTPPEPPAAQPNDPALREALARLNDLPETGASDGDLARTLATLSGAAPLGAVFAALTARAPLSERDRRALALHATDPWVAERRSGKGEPAQAFEVIVAAADAVALVEFATRALVLIDESPEARHDLPAVPRLLEIADQIEDALETESELLVALAHRLEDLAIEAEQAGDE